MLWRKEDGELPSGEDAIPYVMDWLFMLAPDARFAACWLMILGDAAAFRPRVDGLPLVMRWLGRMKDAQRQDTAWRVAEAIAILAGLPAVDLAGAMALNDTFYAAARRVGGREPIQRKRRRR